METEKGKRRSAQILESMNNPTGLFQIEEALEKKILTSGIQHLVNAIAMDKGIQIGRSKID